MNNNLTKEEIERLAILSEEAGEVIQIVGKILRHGYDSVNPNNNRSNFFQLELELADLTFAINLLINNGDINAKRIDYHTGIRMNRKTNYFHYEHENTNNYYSISHPSTGIHI